MLLGVVLPKLKTWLIASCLICVLPIMTEMAVSNLYQVSTIAEQVYLDASRGMVNPLTYLSSTLLCLIPLSLVLLLWLFRGVPWEGLQYQAHQFRSQTLPLGKWRAFWSTGVWCILLLLVGLPIVSLIAKAGWKPMDNNGTTTYGWSLNRFATTCVESVSLHTNEFYWSFLLAVISATLAFSVAAALTLITNPLWKWLVSFLMILLIACPGPLAGLLVTWLMNRSDPPWLGRMYDDTLAAPVVAQQFRLLPIAWLLVLGIQRTIAPSTWEQASMDGLSRGAIFKNVILPNVWGHCTAAMLLLGALSIGELSYSILVLPPGVTTVSMRLFEMLHFGMRHQDSGLCGVLMLLGWSICAAAWFATIGWKTRSER